MDNHNVVNSKKSLRLCWALSFVLVITSGFVGAPIMAKVSTNKNSRASLTVESIFAADSLPEVECDEKSETSWDAQRAQNEKLIEGDLTACKMENKFSTVSQCLQASDGRWNGNIRYSLTTVLQMSGWMKSTLNDSSVSASEKNRLLAKFRRNIFELMVIRDSFPNARDFDQIYEDVLQAIRTNEVPALIKGMGRPDVEEAWLKQNAEHSENLKKNPELEVFLENLEHSEVPIPYGSAVCAPAKKDLLEPRNLEKLSQCFVAQETFVDSVRRSREMDRSCHRVVGGRPTCGPIIHGLKKQSLKPCGSVLGTWQADAKGNILANTLIVQSQDTRSKGPFDSKVLQHLIRQMDTEEVAPLAEWNPR